MEQLSGLVQAVADRVDRQGLRSFSRSSGVSISTIRSFLTGHDPRHSSLQALARSVGWQVLLDDLSKPPPQETRALFSASTIPHRGLARCGVSGWGRPEALDPLPAPASLSDPEAFYVEATGRSMEPEGIRSGDTVLVSPQLAPEVGGRVYIEDREGRGAIKRVVGLTPKVIQLRGWMADGSSFKEFTDDRQLDYVKLIAPVVAVYERRPEVGELEQRKADPRRPDDALGSVPLLGYAAAGNDIVFDTALEDGSRVSPPPAGETGLGAIAVRGNSYFPMARDGDTIYIDISRPFAPADCIGRPVVARDRQGGTYLKTLRRGDDAKRWNLESADLRYETMTNVDLEQVFPVRWIALSKGA